MTLSMLVIGECMMELRYNPNGELVKSFAGDTYNSAVYAKRYAQSVECSYLSAVGTDEFSADMVNTWQEKGLITDLVGTSDTSPLGIYGVSTDEQGERSFTYWRKDSAASHMMSLIDTDKVLSKANDFELVYFSGISLVILSDEDKAALLALIEKLSAQGVKVAFDPNYRPKMWRSREHAIEWTEKAYALSDIVFPGLEDHQDLFLQQSKEDIFTYFEHFKASEIVVKCGGDGVFTKSETGDSHLPFTPAPKQVDSTAAGDSFAGTYLAARLTGKNAADAVVEAARVARVVVQHPGAIIDAEAYQTSLAK